MNVKTHNNISMCIARQGETHGWVYCVGNKGQFVKIGWTRDVERRIKELQTGSPHRINLISVIPGNRVSEKEIHNQLCYRHYRGEWFFDRGNYVSNMFDHLFQRFVTGEIKHEY